MVGLAIFQPTPLQSSAQEKSATTAAPVIGTMPTDTTVAELTHHRLTGADMDTCKRWAVCGTDLGIPFTLENGSIGYLFGDTFSTRSPSAPNSHWRAPVILRSNVTPSSESPIVFDSAAGVAGDGLTPEIIPNGHRSNGEVSVIPTDGVSFPETGDQIISYMSVVNWDSVDGRQWQSRYASLAWSPDGVHYYRTGPHWENNVNTTDPYQMWSMQRDGDYVYIVSVRVGRQHGPMMLSRVRWDSMLDKSAYEYWDGLTWGDRSLPILVGDFAEPSFRKLDDGTWLMAYLNCATGKIVTRYASSPTSVWSDEKEQVPAFEQPSLTGGTYGGFIHPRSTRSNLTLMVSIWTTNSDDGRTDRYDVMQYNGSL